MHTVLTSIIGKVDLYRQNIHEKENKNQAIYRILSLPLGKRQLGLSIQFHCRCSSALPDCATFG